MDVIQIVYNIAWITIGVTVGSYIGSEIAYRNMIRKVKRELKKVIDGQGLSEDSIPYLVIQLLTQLAKRYNIKKEIVNIIKEVLE